MTSAETYAESDDVWCVMRPGTAPGDAGSTWRCHACARSAAAAGGEDSGRAGRFGEPAANAEAQPRERERERETAIS